MGDPMTSVTSVTPRPGGACHARGRDTPVNPNVTPNVTGRERERDTERDMAERDRPHAHERDTLEPARVPGWHTAKGPRAVLNALHGLPTYGAPRWVDHACRVRLPDGRWCYIAEPYALDTEALADLAYLTENGWRVSVTAERARHYPGRTLAVEIVAEATTCRSAGGRPSPWLQDALGRSGRWLATREGRSRYPEEVSGA